MSIQREVEITVPSQKTDELLAQLRDLPELLGLQVQHGGSLHPPGDVVRVLVKDGALGLLMRVLLERGIGTTSSSSITTSYPASVVSPSAGRGLGWAGSETTWEEMETEIGKESNMTANGLTLMVVAGAVATIGLQTNALHVVIGAMIIAPGFEPVLRISLGLVAGSPAAARRGLVHSVIGYLTLIAAAALTTWFTTAVGIGEIGGRSTYLPPESLYPYWSTFSAPSILSSTVAGVAGAVLVASNRSVLTAGVLVALALVPAAALSGVALASGEIDLMGRALARWAADVGLVALTGAAVFAWKRAQVQRRNMAL